MSYFLQREVVNKKHVALAWSLIIGLAILFYQLVTMKILTREFFPLNYNPQEFSIIYFPMIIFSSISLILSGISLQRFLIKIEFDYYLVIIIPWYLYGVIQLGYFFKHNTLVITILFALAAFLKLMIALGFLLCFRSQTIQRTLEISNLKYSKEKYRLSREEYRIRTWQKLAFSYFSHELKTPVLVIRNFAESILNHLDRNEYYQTKIVGKKLLESASVLSSAVDSVKIASEPIDLTELSYESINSILDNSCQIVKQFYETADTEIRKQYSANMDICVIKDSITQAFANLIKNAIEASALDIGGKGSKNVVNPKLLLRTKKLQSSKGSFVCVRVIDYGPGIPKEIQSEIFQPYYSTKEGINRGLGLWVVRNFIEIFGGTITISSPLKGLQKGTCFEIQLPLAFPKSMSKNEFWEKKILPITGTYLTNDLVSGTEKAKDIFLFAMKDESFLQNESFLLNELNYPVMNINNFNSLFRFIKQYHNMILKVFFDEDLISNLNQDRIKNLVEMYINIEYYLLLSSELKQEEIEFYKKIGVKIIQKNTLKLFI